MRKDDLIALSLAAGTGLGALIGSYIDNLFVGGFVGLGFGAAGAILLNGMKDKNKK